MKPDGAKSLLYFSKQVLLFGKHKHLDDGYYGNIEIFCASFRK
jgi:hypothetical protein